MSTATVKHSARRSAASSRANLRIDPQSKRLITRAARLERVNFTEFVVKSSLLAAEMVLVGRTRFVLPPDQWKKFTSALDAPPREIPALRQLFAEASVFEPA